MTLNVPFLQTLSVWETLRFAARLSLPAEVTRARSIARCEQTLGQMGLWRVRHTKVRMHSLCASL